MEILIFEIEHDRLVITYKTQFSNHLYQFNHFGEMISIKKLKAFIDVLRNIDKIEDGPTYMIIDDDINDHDLSVFDGMATFFGIYIEKNSFHIYYWNDPHSSFETFINLDKCKDCFIELFEQLISVYENYLMDIEIKKEYILK